MYAMYALAYTFRDECMLRYSLAYTENVWFSIHVYYSCSMLNISNISLVTDISYIMLIACIYNPSSQPSSASRTYTSVRSLSQSLKDSQYGLSLLPEVCKLCDIYLTIPMTSATAERSFSSMRRLKTYLRQTMSQERLNDCMILHIHKHRTDALCIESLARYFVQSVDKRSDYFGKTAQ